MVLFSVLDLALVGVKGLKQKIIVKTLSLLSCTVCSREPHYRVKKLTSSPDGRRLLFSTPPVFTDLCSSSSDCLLLRI